MGPPAEKAPPGALPLPLPLRLPFLLPLPLAPAPPKWVDGRAPVTTRSGHTHVLLCWFMKGKRGSPAPGVAAPGPGCCRGGDPPLGPREVGGWLGPLLMTTPVLPGVGEPAGQTGDGC